MAARIWSPFFVLNSLKIETGKCPEYGKIWRTELLRFFKILLNKNEYNKVCSSTL